MNIMILPCRYCFILLLITALFLLTACTTDVLTRSAQEVTGGVGAGLSEYQGPLRPSDTSPK